MRYIQEKEEIEKARYYLELAAIEATKSTCRKSQRGAILVKDSEVIGKGYNKVTLEKLCSPCIREEIKDNSRVELCSAIHAEQMAIIDAKNKNKSKFLSGSKMYHIKIKNSQMRPSGKPSCAVCSRMICEAGIEFVLWHKEGYAIYSPKELNELSFEYFKNILDK